MKRFLFLLVVIIMVTWMACKPASKEEPVAVPATIFQALVVKHHVKDYGKFKAVFAARDSMRVANGMFNIGVARGIEDSNTVAVINRVDDLAKVRAFTSSADLKTAMDSSGVDSQPTFDWINVVRNDSSHIAQNERLMVKHHVKDFAQWLKVYDKEGKDTRASFGLMDRALGRGMEDSNMVYVVFAVTDMDKAMARGKSEELKKLMDEAGVDSTPEMFAYRFDIFNE